ncbi:MAG TPA: penicillin-binding protein activator [Xanthomonadaceae bacterium]|nr:penicillin-binding protein activator [Xanthomonadaceae bacterium]
MTMQTKTLFLSACLLAMAGCATVRVTEAPRPAGPPDGMAGVPAATPAVDDGRWHFDATTRMPAAPDGYQPPTSIGFLLPLSGHLARAAAPVRDGFLAGYYGETRPRPEIRFYDTASAGAVAAYRQAVADGNAFIVGPLGREEVDAVFATGTLAVPTLALNRGDLAPPAGHAGFSLSPEDEGMAAAEYLLDNGARNVLVLQGTDDSMRRAAAAFGERLRESGGQVFQVLTIADEPAASAPQLQAAVQAAVAAGTPIDAVFFGVRGSKAHLLAAQLQLAGLDALPMVATSQITIGSGDPMQDILLDGIAFPTETWTVLGLPGLPPAASLGERLPTARGAAARLFAFGHDAWLVTAYPSVAAGDHEGALHGATGRLRIDEAGNVLRTPTWSTFREGRPVPLD